MFPSNRTAQQCTSRCALMRNLARNLPWIQYQNNERHQLDSPNRSGHIWLPVLFALVCDPNGLWDSKRNFRIFIEMPDINKSVPMPTPYYVSWIVKETRSTESMRFQLRIKCWSVWDMFEKKKKTAHMRLRIIRSRKLKSLISASLIFME